MNAIYGIVGGYAVLVFAAAVALALVPFVRFVTRRGELLESIGGKRQYWQNVSTAGRASNPNV